MTKTEKIAHAMSISRQDVQAYIAVVCYFTNVNFCIRRPVSVSAM